MLFTLVFGLGASFAGLAGMMLGPLTSVEPGMGEPLLILAFVVIIIGGIGSIRGAFIAAVIVGLVDTLGRVFCRCCCAAWLPNITADTVGFGFDADLHPDGGNPGVSPRGLFLLGLVNKKSYER